MTAAQWLVYAENRVAPICRLVTGDKRDLLPLQNYHGIPIIDAREAVERITA